MTLWHFLFAWKLQQKNASLKTAILGELYSAVCTKLTSSSSNRIRRAGILAYIQWKLYNKVTQCGSHLAIQATLLGPSNWLHVPYNYCATRPTDTSLASVPDPHTTQRQKAQRIQVVAWNLTVCQLLVQVTEVNYMANLICKHNSLTVSISLQFLYTPPPTSGEWKNQSSLID